MERTLARTLFFLLLVVAAIVGCYLYVDRPVAEAAFLLKGTGWHTLAKAVSQLARHEFFTALLAVGFVWGGIDALNNGPSYRSKSLLYLCTVVAAAMLAGDLLKLVFGRARPELLFSHDIYGFFPLAGDYLHYSFPSGHTLRIFSSMTGLGLVFPRVRVPALAVACLVGFCRVPALKHYPSDVLFGAFIGITIAVWGWRILYPYGCADTHR